MGKTSKAKAGKGRKISQVKRSNQKRNKLVKKGKIKPNSNPRFVPGLRKKPKGDAKVKLDPEQEAEKERARKEREEEMYNEMADMIDDEDLEYLRANKGYLNQDFDELEAKAMQRINKQSGRAVETKSLLPIKTKMGIVSQTIEVAKKDEEEDVEMENGEEDENGEEEEEDNGVQENVSVVDLLAERKRLLDERKLQIGSLASNFLENPQERLQVLEKLTKMMEENVTAIKATVMKLVSASLLEIFKDVIPSYKIQHQEMDDNTKLKKETLKLQKFENGLLSCSKTFLVKLEKILNEGRRQSFKDSTGLGMHSLTCLCDLLATHPQFNYANNIIHLVVPFLTHSDSRARNIVHKSLTQIFRNDKRGEVSFQVVRKISQVIKTRKHKIHPIVLDTLLGLRISNVNLDREKDEEAGRNKNVKRLKKLQLISKKEKKHKKKLAKLEKELLEAQGEESKKVKERHFTEITKIVFAIYFRILKTMPRSKLIRPVLEGLSKFGHAINIDFFQDLLTVFTDMIQNGDLSLPEILHCVRTVFIILSGQGDYLTIDPAGFYVALYNKMLELDSNTNECVVIAVLAINDMLIRRKKKVSKGRVLAFAKRLATISLQTNDNGSLATLALLRETMVAHPSLETLLDTEECGSGLFEPFTSEPEHSNASNSVLWELHLLHEHLNPSLRSLAKYIVSQGNKQSEEGGPVTGLSQELRKPPKMLFESIDNTAFAIEGMSDVAKKASRKKNQQFDFLDDEFKSWEAKLQSTPFP